MSSPPLSVVESLIQSDLTVYRSRSLPMFTLLLDPDVFTFGHATAWRLHDMARQLTANMYTEGSLVGKP